MPDDYSANRHTTGRLTVGGSVKGELKSTGDCDGFAEPLEGGRFLRASHRPLTTLWGAFAVCLAVIVILAVVRPAQAQVSVELEATANGQTQIDLSWEATISQDWIVLSYAVEASPTGADGSWNQLTWLTISEISPNPPDPGDSYSHTGLTGGTTRYYRIVWLALRIKGITYTSDDSAEGVSNTTSATTSSATSSTTSN